MILIITTTERNRLTGFPRLIVSHGIDLETDLTVILPNVHPEEIGAKIDLNTGEYVLYNKPVSF